MCTFKTERAVLVCDVAINQVRERLEAVIGPVADGVAGDSPRASGTLEAHYAPRTPLLLLPRDALAAEAQQQVAFGKRVAVLALDVLPDGLDGVALPAASNQAAPSA